MARFRDPQKKDISKPSSKNDESIAAWVVAESHHLSQQRAIHPLAPIAYDGAIELGPESAQTEHEKRLWHRINSPQVRLSRVRSIPVIGRLLHRIGERTYNHPAFAIVRGSTAPSRRLRNVQASIDEGLGRSLLDALAATPLPVVAAFPLPALVADSSGYPRIYTIVSSVSVDRHWVAPNPRNSRIHYFAPCGRTVARLKSFGVPDERISLTGFPFSKDVLGDEELDILRKDLGQRLHHLDPDDRFWPLHGTSVRHFLGRKYASSRDERPLTITYAPGPDGVRLETAREVVRSLRPRLDTGNIAIRLLTEMNPQTAEFFSRLAAETPSVQVVHAETSTEYLRMVNGVIRETDILWGAASELSFLCGLGIPIIINPPNDDDEEQNARWLLEIQAGYASQSPETANVWLFALLHEGHLAEAAWDGFLKARKYGTYKIEEILRTGAMARETSVLRR